MATKGVPGSFPGKACFCHPIRLFGINLIATPSRLSLHIKFIMEIFKPDNGCKNIIGTPSIS